MNKYNLNAVQIGDIEVADAVLKINAKTDEEVIKALKDMRTACKVLGLGEFAAYAVKYTDEGEKYFDVQCAQQKFEAAKK